MQGYIINITPQKNEDIILSILTPNKIKKLYRFYGARHSIIQLGKKIDFESETNGMFLPKLRNITGLNFKWEKEIERIGVWQYFLQLLYKHFYDIENIDTFYFEALELGAKKMEYQNPMRVMLEIYAMLLDFEGRIPYQMQCFICTQEINNEIALARSFLPAHQQCIATNDIFKQEKIIYFFQNKSTILFDDLEIHKLWNILIKGI